MLPHFLGVERARTEYWLPLRLQPDLPTMALVLILQLLTLWPLCHTGITCTGTQEARGPRTPTYPVPPPFHPKPTYPVPRLFHPKPISLVPRLRQPFRPKPIYPVPPLPPLFNPKPTYPVPPLPPLFNPKPTYPVPRLFRPKPIYTVPPLPPHFRPKPIYPVPPLPPLFNPKPTYPVPPPFHPKPTYPVPPLPPLFNPKPIYPVPPLPPLFNPKPTYPVPPPFHPKPTYPVPPLPPLFNPKPTYPVPPLPPLFNPKPTYPVPPLPPLFNPKPTYPVPPLPPLFNPKPTYPVPPLPPLFNPKPIYPVPPLPPLFNPKPTYPVPPPFHPKPTYPVTPPFRPKPWLQAQPAAVVSPGINVTLTCQAPQPAWRFVLFKSGEAAPVLSQEVFRHLVEFFLEEVTEAQAGSYHCRYSSSPLWARAVWSQPSDALELLVTDQLPRPSLLVLPAPAEAPGDTVSLRCAGRVGNMSFVLYRVGEAAPLQYLEATQPWADFALPRARAPGTYTCYYHTLAAPYVLSARSEALVISPDGSGPLDYTRGNLVRLGLAGLVLISLATLVLWDWRSWRRAPASA